MDEKSYAYRCTRDKTTRRILLYSQQTNLVQQSEVVARGAALPRMYVKLFIYFSMILICDTQIGKGKSRVPGVKPPTRLRATAELIKPTVSRHYY